MDSSFIILILLVQFTTEQSQKLLLKWQTEHIMIRLPSRSWLVQGTVPKVAEHVLEGPHNVVTMFIKKWKLRYFSYISRSSDLTKMVLQGTAKERQEKVDKRGIGKTVLTLLHSERPKLYTMLAFLSAIGLKSRLGCLLAQLGQLETTGGKGLLQSQSQQPF